MLCDRSVAGQKQRWQDAGWKASVSSHGFLAPTSKMPILKITAESWDMESKKDMFVDIYVICLDVSKWFCLQKHVAFSDLDGFWMDFLEFSQLFTADFNRFQPLWASVSAPLSKSWMRSCAGHPSEPTWFLGGHGDIRDLWDDDGGWFLRFGWEENVVCFWNH